MYRIPRGDISLARRFIDKKQEGVYPAMAKESVLTKLRRKVDKEFADELQRQQDIEQQDHSFPGPAQRQKCKCGERPVDDRHKQRTESERLQQRSDIYL